MRRTPPRQTNQEQIRHWNGLGGQAWIEIQPTLDAMFQPFEDLLVDAACAAPARRLLDVGCGTGCTTLAFARRLGPAGECVGIDVSATMIAQARLRACAQNSPANFICADAQTHAFAPASFDRIVSRFGVMFFDDPHHAFCQLRRAATADAELHCVAWRGADENPFMTAAERAAPGLLRKPRSDAATLAPGPFAFADNARVAELLRQSGWNEIRIQPLDLRCRLPVTALDGYITRMGPIGTVLRTLPPTAQATWIDVLRRGFAPFVHADEVHYTAACWMIQARAAPPPDAATTPSILPASPLPGRR